MIDDIKTDFDEELETIQKQYKLSARKAKLRSLSKMAYQEKIISNMANKTKEIRLDKKDIDKKLRDLKESEPCKDCNNKFPYYVMQFDHRPEEHKLFILSQAKLLNPTLRILEDEIAKCDIVCANCHAIRTHERGQCRKNFKDLLTQIKSQLMDA